MTPASPRTPLLPFTAKFFFFKLSALLESTYSPGAEGLALTCIPPRLMDNNLTLHPLRDNPLLLCSLIPAPSLRWVLFSPLPGLPLTLTH